MHVYVNKTGGGNRDRSGIPAGGSIRSAGDTGQHWIVPIPAHSRPEALSAAGTSTLDFTRTHEAQKASPSRSTASQFTQELYLHSMIQKKKKLQVTPPSSWRLFATERRTVS